MPVMKIAGTWSSDHYRGYWNDYECGTEIKAICEKSNYTVILITTHQRSCGTYVSVIPFWGGWVGMSRDGNDWEGGIAGVSMSRELVDTHPPDMGPGTPNLPYY